MRIAIKFAYDGTCFHGYQRQPDVRTVEGELIKALISLGAIASAKDSIFRSSSRTDSGVSAIGNVLAFNTEFRSEELPRALNSKIRDIWIWGYAVVPKDFNPRHAISRWYRHYFSARVRPEDLRRASHAFIGRHDFTAFAYRDDRSPIRTIEKIEVSGDKSFTTLDIWGDSFLRGMVRRIAWAMKQVASGELTLADIEKRFHGEGGGFGSAPAEPTVLMDVDYGFDFIAHEGEGESIQGLAQRTWSALLSHEIMSIILTRSMGRDADETGQD